MTVNKDRPLSIAAIVMTANEMENIGKCLRSLGSIDTVFMLDSLSTDGTLAIAAEFSNVRVVQVQWQGYARTFNEGVRLAADHDWILRIDADEELVGDIRFVAANTPQQVTGLVVRREVHFLGERLRYGPHSRLKMLRLFRSGRGHCEETSADEHIIVEGEVRFEKNFFVIDRDQKPFGRWLQKHIRAARTEAAFLQAEKTDMGKIDRFNKLKRQLKFRVYFVFPPFVRAFLYFFYRFFFLLECLGGRSNVTWCIMQGLWYRLLIDLYTLYPRLLDEE